MNKTLIATAVIGISAVTGLILNEYKEVPVVETKVETEIVKVVHQPDGMINIVNKDGYGILLDGDEKLEEWIESSYRDEPWIEDLKDVVKQAIESDPLLKNTKTIEAHYEKTITTSK